MLLGIIELLLVGGGLLLRFLQGFGLVVTITNSLVCGWFPTRQRGLASGVLLGCIALGAAVGLGIGYIL